jgi:hypothetical protein
MGVMSLANVIYNKSSKMSSFLANKLDKLATFESAIMNENT